MKENTYAKKKKGERDSSNLIPTHTHIKPGTYTVTKTGGFLRCKRVKVELALVVVGQEEIRIVVVVDVGNTQRCNHAVDFDNRGAVWNQK